MSRTPYTSDEIDSSFKLWPGYVDPNRVRTVDEVLASCPARGWADGEQLLGWDEEGGQVAVPASELRAALEAAYDPCMPAWPGMVELED